MGGSPSTPKVEPIPEKQPTKPLSEGARAAVAAAQDKARKNRGINASILTNRGGLASAAIGNDTLG